ncbi:Hyaluronan synthase [Turicibacter sanguinis]|nr:Hyaluronan synthase [Turicibacter sanguinis]
MNRKVSIIVPIYNVEKRIHKCIESIINQTYGNLEIILVNDGSSDNCPFICNMYEIKDDRVTVIHKQNGGLSSARNAGLNIATGDYICFIDGDDYINSNMIEILVNHAIKENADIVHCDFECIDEEGKVLHIKNRGYNNKKYFDGYETICGYVKKYKVKVVAWNKLYKRELFDNLRFDEGYVYEDELIFPKLISRSKRNIILNKKLYYYVYSPQGITKSKLNINKIKSKKKLICFLEEYYLENYPELMNHIYITLCLICFDMIKQIKQNDQIVNSSIEIEWFKEKYLEIYQRRKKEKKFIKRAPLKKELFCYLVYKFLKLKENFLS